MPDARSDRPPPASHAPMAAPNSCSSTGTLNIDENLLRLRQRDGLSLTEPRLKKRLHIRAEHSRLRFAALAMRLKRSCLEVDFVNLEVAHLFASQSRIEAYEQHDNIPHMRGAFRVAYAEEFLDLIKRESALLSGVFPRDAKE